MSDNTKNYVKSLHKKIARLLDEKEELQARIEELEQQNAFECGCVEEYMRRADIAERTLEIIASQMNEHSPVDYFSSVVEKARKQAEAEIEEKYRNEMIRQ